jgi:hypothetical protein
MSSIIFSQCSSMNEVLISTFVAAVEVLANGC